MAVRPSSVARRAWRAQAPTINLRANEGFMESLQLLLRECKAESRFEAAAKAKTLLETVGQSGIDVESDAFLQEGRRASTLKRLVWLHSRFVRLPARGAAGEIVARKSRDS